MSDTGAAGAWWPNTRLAGARILIIDDDQDARDLLAFLLSGCGASVEAVATARDGLDAFLRHPPALIVSDIGMPGEDGRWLARQIRALPAEAGGGTPIIAVTAFASEPGDVPAGFQAWLRKPMEPPELCDRVARVLRRAA